MRLALVVNPTAGGGRGRRVLEAVLPMLRAAGLDGPVYVCADGSDSRRLALSAVEQGAELVVAVGGDGHAAAVATGLLGTDAALGLVPAGSANDYARALGMSRRDPRGAVDILAKGRVERVDVVRVENATGVHHILNVAGTGFDAVVAATAERIPLARGPARYVLAVVRELPRFRASTVRLAIDGERHEQRAMMVAVANGSAYGGGMRVAPAAHLQSGRLEVCIVGELTAIGFLRAFPRVFRGTHVDHPRVTMLRGRVIEIDADPPFAVIGDGEQLGPLPARFTVLPAALTVVVSAAAPLA